MNDNKKKKMNELNILNSGSSNGLDVHQGRINSNEKRDPMDKMDVLFF